MGDSNGSTRFLLPTPRRLSLADEVGEEIEADTERHRRTRRDGQTDRQRAFAHHIVVVDGAAMGILRCTEIVVSTPDFYSGTETR